MRTPVAVITGGSRGLGFETARQLGILGYRLVLGSKDKKRLQVAAQKLKEHGYDVHCKAVNMASARSIASFGAWAAEFAPIDVLVNAAGILPESNTAPIDVLVNAAGILPESRGNKGATVLGAGDKEVSDTLAVNVLGPWRLCKILALQMANGGRIVNVSSGMGGLTEMGSGYFGYRASKAALNVLSRTLAQELKTQGILVNSVCPGWVKTDMGGASATRSVQEGASGIVWAATLQAGGPTGGFFRDGQPIAW